MLGVLPDTGLMGTIIICVFFMWTAIIIWYWRDKKGKPVMTLGAVLELAEMGIDVPISGDDYAIARAAEVPC